MKFDRVLVEKCRKRYVIAYERDRSVDHRAQSRNGIEAVLRVLAEQDVEDIVADVHKLIPPDAKDIEGTRNLVNMILLSSLGVVEE